MNTRRTAKAAEAIRETVSLTILCGLRDPRVKNVTVLRAEVSGDLRAAKIYVSVMGDAKAQSLTMHGLDSARGFIQSKVADRLQTKNTPVLKFVLDPGVKFSAETSQMLRTVLPEGTSSAIGRDSDQSHVQPDSGERLNGNDDQDVDFDDEDEEDDDDGDYDDDDLDDDDDDDDDLDDDDDDDFDEVGDEEDEDEKGVSGSAGVH